MQMYGVRLIQGGTMTDRRQGASPSPTHLLHQAEQAAGRLFAAHALGFIRRSREHARAKVLRLTDEVRNANRQYCLP